MPNISLLLPFLVPIPTCFRSPHSNHESRVRPPLLPLSGKLQIGGPYRRIFFCWPRAQLVWISTKSPERQGLSISWKLRQSRVRFQFKVFELSLRGGWEEGAFVEQGWEDWRGKVESIHVADQQETDCLLDISLATTCRPARPVDNVERFLE